MSYSVDWVAKIFTIPQGDLTFQSGSNYLLSLVDVHEELRRLEWAFADGLWAPRIANWYETVTLSGIPKSPSVEITNGYTFDFTGSDYNVILSDYDNNLVDVYIPSNGISILSNNSVGRQTVVSGSGVTGQDKLDIANEVWNHADGDFTLKVIKNKNSLKKTGAVWQLIIYDDDSSTPILTKDLKDLAGNNITDLAAGVLAEELKTSV